MTVVEKNERIIKRVKKALNLASNNPSQEESQTAMLKAQEMLAKYNLSMSDIDMEEETDKKEKVVNEGDATDYTRLQWWMKHLGMIIADNFRCYCFTRSGGGKKKLVFLGVDEDVQIAKDVYAFAVESIKYSSTNYIKENDLGGDRAKTTAIKNDYISGYLSGLKDKFKEQVERENWGLILVKDDAVVEKFEGMNMTKGRATTRSSAHNDDAVSQGYQDGKSFNNNRRGIEG